MTSPTLERAQAAAKREIDRLQRARIEITPGRFTEGLGWINLNDVAEAATRAVLMAVLDEADAVGETEYRFIRAILAPEWPVESVTADLDGFKRSYIKPEILAEGE